MRLAIYQPRVSYYKGGGEVVPLEQAKWLAEMGHDITLITTKANFIRTVEGFNQLTHHSGIKVEYIHVPKNLAWIYDIEPGHNWKRWDAESLHIGRLAYEYFLKNKFDAIVCHNLFDGIAVPLNQVCIVHLHGTPSKFESHHYTLSTIPKAFIAVSESVLTKWSKNLSLKSQLYVVKNGIDINKFRLMDTKTKYDFLFVGRLLPVKGIDTAIYALEAIRNKYGTKPSLAIAGTGPYKAELVNLARSLKVNNQVQFLEYIPDPDLPTIYSRASVTIFPSKDKEGVLTTILEAASCRRAIISTNVGGIPEFIEHNANGILVNPNNIQQLADSMYGLLNDPSLQTKLGNRARLIVEENWSWQTRSKELENVYEQIFTNNKSKQTSW